MDDLLGLRVDELQGSLSANRMLGGVDDARGDLCLVAHTDKAGHVGLYHYVFLRHTLALDITIVHIGGVCNTHKTPGGQTLRQRELQRHPTLAISRHHGVAESGLLQIMTKLFLRALLFFFL